MTERRMLFGVPRSESSWGRQGGKCGIVIRSRVPWAKGATFRARFGLNEPFTVSPSRLETLFLSMK